ncbi:MAG: RidA family protein [Actinobacteria bacterium]|nr:RidA family protein [Actinomycetota bacterium]
MSKPVAHYSPSTRAGDWLIVSGQVGLADGQMADGLVAQTKQVLANLSSVLDAGGATLDDVAKCVIFLSDIDDFAVVNGLYAEAFGDHLPSRSAVAVAGLPLGALVEIEAWAYLGPAAGE